MARGFRSYFDPVAFRFVGLFFLFAVGLTLLIQAPFVDQYVIAPYTRVLASIGAFFIDLTGYSVTTSGSVIRHGAFAVDIKRGCDGVVASILLISACVAYPFSWRNRLLGTLWGYILIFTLNMVRIVGLFLIGLRGSNQAFDFFHVYVSQFAVIALTMVFWVFWAGRSQTAVRS